MYRPEGEIVPIAALCVQVTAVLEVPVTAALNCCVPLAESVTAPGVMLTEIGGVSVTTAVADLVLSVFDVAFTNTVCAEVTDDGAE